MSDHDEKITATLEEPSPAVGQEPSSSPLLWLFPKRWRTRERLLVLKIDFLLLLWAFVAGLTKDMDQSATTQAYVSGMKESLRLDGNELVWFTTYFSIAYAICIVPSQLIQTRLRPSLFLPACQILWGTVTLFTFAAKNAQTIYGLRFILGIFEATSWPGIVALILNWYTPSELGKRVAIFGVSDVAGSMFLGILQAALYKNMNGVAGLEGWQWLFIVSGVITIVVGTLGLFIIPDSPAITRALWLTKDERILSRERLAHYGIKTAELIDRRLLWRKVKATVKSPLSWLFAVAYVQWAWSQRANSYFLLFLKGLTNTDGSPRYSTYTVNLLPLGGYAISIVASISLNAISDKFRWRLQISALAAAIQLVSCSVLAAWPNSTSTIMAFYYITFSTAAGGYALVTWLADILKCEPEARSLLVGVVVTLTYVGHASFPLRVWRVADSPRYPIGFPLAAAFSAGWLVALFLIWWWVRRNPDVVERGFGIAEAVESAPDTAVAELPKVGSKESWDGSKEKV